MISRYVRGVMVVALVDTLLIGLALVVIGVPLVVGQASALHPVAILVALTAGTVLAGLAGALLVIPVTAAAWAAIDHLRSRDPARPPPG